MDNALLAFQKTRDHYLSNADETIAKREFRKASELLWGGVTQTIKELAGSKSIRIYSHREFRTFILTICKEIKDQELYDLFISIEQLHRNFYDEIISEEEFPLYYKKVYLFIGKLSNLIKFRKS